jgi:hypothetical protein
MGIARTKGPRALGRRNPGLKRQPENTDRNRCFRESIVTVRLVPTSTKGWEEYNAETIPKVPVSNGLVRFRVSTRWCGGSTARQRWHHIPFIDRHGLIHATSVARWHCSAPQLLATITSTVFKRLWGRTRHGPHKYRPSANLLYRVAQQYAITNDDSFYKRCLSMLLRGHRKQLSQFVYYKLKRLDANNRFLYDQALHGALWFQSRADRCPSRALSTIESDVLRDVGKPRGFSGSRCNFDRLVTAWARVYSGPSATPLNPTFLLPLGRGVSVFRGKSLTRHRLG